MENTINFDDYDFYIRPGITDMRNRSTGLSRIVQEQMQLKPFSKSIFLFCGRDRKKIVAILWDNNGWIEISKKLECKGRFKWPSTEEVALKTDFSWIINTLKGFDRSKAFPILNPEYVN